MQLRRADDFRFFRGVMFALCISACLWAVIVSVAMWCCRG